jgi:pimeloyl-ACP methyl ester carboxylesterase
MAQATSYRTYLPGRWGQVHVRIATGPDTAPPLLMLHQTPKSGWIWEPLFAPLSQNRTLIAPDTPGYGASDAPPEPAAIEDYAGEMLALMDRLAKSGVIASGPFDAIGYHTGSVTATALGVAAPDRVRRLILVSLAAYTADERAAKVATLPDMPKLAADGSHLAAMWRHIDSLTDPRATIAWKQASLAENLRAGPGMYRGYRAVYGFDLIAALQALTQPVLILNPEDDLHAVTARNAHLPPHGTVIDLPRAGHGLFEIERDTIAALVDQFLGG